MDLRTGIVSVAAPRLTVVTPARGDVVLSGVTATLRYVGTPADFATYTPISTQGGTTLLFQFDVLLFDQQFGFYMGTLWFNGTPYAQFKLQYTADASVPAPLQLSTTEPYTPPTPWATPNQSGTGVSGPGTFVGLKDCPASYSGAAGWAVQVNGTQTGLVFQPQALTMGPVLLVLLPPPTPQYAGQAYFATNARKAGEAAGVGTGCPVWCDGSHWRTFYDNSIAAA